MFSSRLLRRLVVCLFRPPFAPAPQVRRARVCVRPCVAVASAGACSSRARTAFARATAAAASSAVLALLLSARSITTAVSIRAFAATRTSAVGLAGVAVAVARAIGIPLFRRLTRVALPRVPAVAAIRAVQRTTCHGLRWFAFVPPRPRRYRGVHRSRYPSVVRRVPRVALVSIPILHSGCGPCASAAAPSLRRAGSALS